MPPFATLQRDLDLYLEGLGFSAVGQILKVKAPLKIYLGLCFDCLPFLRTLHKSLRSVRLRSQRSRRSRKGRKGIFRGALPKINARPLENTNARKDNYTPFLLRSFCSISVKLFTGTWFGNGIIF